MSVEVRLPDLGEGIEAVDVLTVLVTVGQIVAADDSLIEIESEKATLDVPADSGGTVTAIHVKAGDTIAVGQPLLMLDPIAAGPPPAPVDVQAPVHDVPSTDRAQVAEGPAPQRAMAESERRADAKAGDGPPVAAAPSVRTFAREIGVDVRRVEGSGPTGRISVDDVKAHARHRGPVAATDVAIPLPDFAQWGPVERVRMSRLRRTLAENLARSWATVPHVTLFHEADVTDLEAVRAQYRAQAEARGAKLTVTAFLLPLVAAALKTHPKLNASLDLAAGETVQKRYYHLGVAADTERGLLVPVIRDVDTKGVIDLAVELTGLAERARERQAVARRDAGRDVHDQQSRWAGHGVLHSNRESARGWDLGGGPRGAALDALQRRHAHAAHAAALTVVRSSGA